MLPVAASCRSLGTKGSRPCVWRETRRYATELLEFRRVPGGLPPVHNPYHFLKCRAPRQLKVVGNPNKVRLNTRTRRAGYIIIWRDQPEGRLRESRKSVRFPPAQQTRPMRVPFAAGLRATELSSGKEIWGETTNLSRGGCFVRTRQSFPQGTLLLIEISNQRLRFVTDARVAYALEREGMGLSFLNVPTNQLPILEDWLSSAAGKR